MRRAMKTRASSPPLHVHVDESTPVHVHVKKSQRTSPSKAAQLKIREAKLKKETGNLRATAKVKTRIPWIPPGKASVRDAAYNWEGPTHRLEITPANGDPAPSALRLSDLSTDEEDAVHGRMQQYEKKIDSLMNQVGSLKSQVELRKKEQLLEKRGEQLTASKRVIEEQEEELAEVERENSMLRQSIEKMREETDYSRLEKEHLLNEKDALLKKLVETEMDGAAASKQVSALRETIGALKSEKRMSGAEVNLIARQKELLVQKLETFETTNRTLRHLLREQHSRETDAMRLAEQREVLLKKLTGYEAENTSLLMKLQEREQEVDQLLTQVETEKENARTAGELSKTLETTRAHLQGQLRNKESENNRLNVQIRNVERTMAQQRGEMDHLQEQQKELKRRVEGDKEALKRATRAQKQRADRSEDTAGQLSAQLLEKETQLADALSAAESWRSRQSQALKDRNQMEIEITVMNNRVTHLTEQLHSSEDKARAERDELLDRLHRLTSENTSCKLENERLRANVSTIEDKLTLSQSEIQQLKASVKQYGSLVDSYKSQVLKTRSEADEYSLKLELAEEEGRQIREELNKEIDLVRRQLQGRMAELEPLPELLKLTELKLQESQEQVQSCDRRTAEQSSALTELRVKVEQQGSLVESVREKNLCLLEENKQLQQRVESLERKLEEANLQNRDLVQVIAKREESIHQNQLRLEEKTRECSAMARQLEAAIDDAKHQVDQNRDRAVSKERASQAKVLDLETQLSRTKTELNQHRRSKEDADRRFQSRLQDLRDRLEQSESTNRSLQNYVHFLKASYANVFGDSALTSSTLRPPSPI
ncbi:outer dense fiber protein 2-like isoform X1 [Acipenser oxyrinchus oxyrinchus]|uniref:Outer dense fiber protein 2 n=1 Tax=Acipenser oxyrinchus oxyrinchus TaxID=40147 RepID=A0AAD8CQJ3_ACIOX|nr:outer dense fiber protein 2-like isoform X1 [Acipenser oxyrinchus oxyrinchus]